MSRAWKVGDLVRYNDVANIGLTYIVTKVNDDPWSTYELVALDDDDHTIITDGRQPRWELITVGCARCGSTDIDTDHSAGDCPQQTTLTVGRHDVNV